MKSPRIHPSLSILWSSCFIFAILGCCYLTWIVKIGPKTSTDLFNLVFDQFAPYLGAILAFYFAAGSRMPPRRKDKFVSFWLAISMSAIWNMLIVGMVVLICIDSDRAPEAIKSVKETLPKLGWIVSPVIGYFFGKPEGSSNEH
jgi:hypothetical protein